MMCVYVAIDHYDEIAVFDLFEKAEQWIIDASYGGEADKLKWESVYHRDRQHWCSRDGEVTIDKLEVR